VETLKLKQLETFVWVARLGSFHAAARQLNTTQPAVSSRIAELERTLGVKLLNRTRRACRPTAKGRALVQHAQRLFALTAEIREQLAEPSAVTGVVRLGVADSIAVTWLPELLRQIERQHPALGVELRIDISSTLQRQLVSRELDVACVIGPLLGYNLIGEPLGSLELHWMASPSVCAPERPLAPEELADYPIVTHTGGNHDLLLRAWFRDSPRRPRRIYGCNSLATIIAMTVAGVGICILPPGVVAEHHEAGRLGIVPSTKPLPHNDFLVAWPAEASDAAVREVTRMARAISAAHPAFGARPRSSRVPNRAP
jgi:DNA-binding transcriptional LysR family regulator